MAVLVWPSDLPQFVAKDDLRIGRPDTRQMTPIELGDERVMRGQSRGRPKVTADLYLDFEQKLRFERWVDDDTGGGTEPFLFPAIALHNFPLLEGGEILLDFDGSPILASSWWLVRFDPTAELPAVVAHGRDWRTTMQLKILPTSPVLPA